MRLRAVFFDSVLFLIWTFACFIYLRAFGFRIAFGAFGLAAGFIFGVAVAIRQLRFIQEKGEFRATLKTWAFILLTIIVVVPIVLYLLSTLGLETGIQMISFIYPFIPALYAARIILYLNWEKKNQKHILFDGHVLTRVYAAPRSE